MTATLPPTIEATTPHWRGINHLALITTDMDATVHFYHGMLGARLVATIATPDFRHYFFEFGPQCTVAFFEYADANIVPFTKAVGTPDPGAAQFDHLALNLPDEDALVALQHRPKAADCDVTDVTDVTDVVDHGGVRSVYFSDPNGIALEASWWVLDSTGRAANYHDPRQFADPDPVRALRELQETGKLARVPRTRLA